MDRVLAAERDAQGQIEACRQETERILAEARDTARRIRETTQCRIRRIHEAAHHETAERIWQMRHEAAAAKAAIEDDPAQSAAVEAAAQRLALRLTSRDRGDE
jgi:vacuolar-type H+-ATPase subunit H